MVLYIYIYIYNILTQKEIILGYTLNHWHYTHIYTYMYTHLYTHLYAYMRWINCQHFELLISSINFIYFKLCLQYSKLELVGNCQQGKQHHDTIHFFRNLEMVFPSKFKYEDFRVFVCKPKDIFIFILIKTEHQIRIRVFRVVTSDGDVHLPIWSHSKRKLISSVRRSKWF